MSIRRRLALWYAGLTSLVVIIVVGAAYVVHNRGSYEDVDHSLVTAAEHFRPQLSLQEGEGANAPVTLSDSTVLARLYGPEGDLLAASPGAPSPPPIDALATLREDAGPAYDTILRWLPGGETLGQGAFATERDSPGGSRIRVYVLPVDDRGSTIGYVQTWTSLDRLDRSMRTFRFLMLGLGGGGVLAVWLGSLFIAGQALRPVATMTRTAHAIAASRGFSRRLTEPDRTDELGQLARTFNEMLASLEEAYRLQQRFIADAAHELRAPLTAIQGNMELLAHVRDMSEKERTEALAYVEGEARRLSRIVSELLTLARADAGQTLERRPVELDRALLDLLAEIRPLAGDHRIDVAELQPVSVRGDADRLKQLLMNLLDNSLKYTPPGGSISVGLERDGTQAVLAVRDTGVGIPPEDLQHIFDRFYRADAARTRDPGGTGLGLSIVRWIVDQHEGAISVQSEPGQGTTVTVRLPALAEETAEHSPSVSQPATS